MKVKFTEGSSALDVPEVGRVERGEEVEVSKELGEQLLEQGWEQVGAAKKRTTKKRTTKTESAEPAAAPAENTPEPGPNQESD